jgi:CheY-like chemotaxis protein
MFVENHYVLVVDDDPDIRNAVGIALETLGYDVAVAANGQEALNVLNDKGAPCVIFLDLMMPFMNGPQLREKLLLNPETAKIPIVVISADGNVRDKAKVIGVEEYLKKPIGFEQINKTTARYCRAGA